MRSLCQRHSYGTIYNKKETSRHPTDATGYVDHHTKCRWIFYDVLQANLCSKIAPSANTNYERKSSFQ